MSYYITQNINHKTDSRQCFQQLKEEPQLYSQIHMLTEDSQNKNKTKSPW